MIESNFQLTEQRIISFDYKTNKNFKFSGSLDLEYNINVNSTIVEDGIGVVTLDITVFKGKNFEEVPFIINISIEGVFNWIIDIKEEDLKILLDENATSILLSYIRPFISQITLFSGNLALILPLINFTEKSNLK